MGLQACVEVAPQTINSYYSATEGPIARAKDALSYERTQLIIDAMVSPIPEKMFDTRKDEWDIYIPKHETLVPSINKPGTSPLKLN